MNAGANLPPRDPRLLEPDDGKDMLGDFLILLGLVCMAVGAGLIYPPAGLLVIGLELFLIGHVLEARGAKRAKK